MSFGDGRIVLDQVSRTYDTADGVVRALDGISVEIGSGSSVGVMGASGCGKSTLLGLIGGLDTATSGQVTVGARDLNRMGRRARTALRQRHFGFVFQRDNLLPFLTAAENVALQIALGDGPAGDRSPDDRLGEFGLGGQTTMLPDQLSGGQRQRVAVASALAHGPSVILADEPTGSLDDANAGRVVDLLLSANRRTGATLIVVSHDATVCARLSRTLSLLEGRLVDDTAAVAPTTGER